MRLLLTRAESERSAAILRGRGHEVVVAPLTEVEAVAADWGAGPWSGVLITSANAPRVLADRAEAAALTSLPVYAVGGRSGDAARAAGFADVTVADGDVHALAALVAAHGRPPHPLLYLAAEDRAGDLGGDLGTHGIAVTTCVVYRAAARDSLPPQAVAALSEGRIDGVLHYSQRSVAIYLACATAAGLLDKALIPRQYCLSEQVAARLVSAGARHLRIADRPVEAAMFALLEPV